MNLQRGKGELEINLERERGHLEMNPKRGSGSLEIHLQREGVDLEMNLKRGRGSLDTSAEDGSDSDQDEGKVIPFLWGRNIENKDTNSLYI